MREVLVGIVALAVVLGISFFWGWRTCAKNQEGKITEESVTEGAYMVFGQNKK